MRTACPVSLGRGCGGARREGVDAQKNLGKPRGAVERVLALELALNI